MDELLLRLMRLNEDSSGVKALYKVYHDVERGIDPDLNDVFTALYMMKEYYVDYLDWYSRAPAKVRKDDKIIIENYKKRLREVMVAMGSHDRGSMIVALDTAVNQWHRDYPVITHLVMGQEDDELKRMVDNVAEILTRLGRLPKDGSYQY